jgi:hypothetical protein
MVDCRRRTESALLHQRPQHPAKPLGRLFAPPKEDAETYNVLLEDVLIEHSSESTITALLQQVAFANLWDTRLIRTATTALQREMMRTELMNGVCEGMFMGSRKPALVPRRAEKLVERYQAGSRRARDRVFHFLSLAGIDLEIIESRTLCKNIEAFKALAGIAGAYERRALECLRDLNRRTGPGGQDRDGA